MFAADNMGVSHSTFRDWFRKRMYFETEYVKWPSKVIQGRWFWYQSKARMRLSISHQ